MPGKQAFVEVQAVSWPDLFAWEGSSPFLGTECNENARVVGRNVVDACRVDWYSVISVDGGRQG